ncbi:hypothetical protein GOA86_17615 [Sinorhizobium meliloti]|nr:hypothetical protein [Sinorhizobium meliloti]
MNSEQLIAGIEAEIAAKRAEIDKLEIAVAVIERMAKTKRQEAPLFTVRKRVEEKPKRAKPKVTMADARAKILEVLSGGEALTSGEIAERGGLPAKAVWNAVYSMRQNGTLATNDETRRHSLPEAAPEPQAETDAAA